MDLEISDELCERFRTATGETVDQPAQVGQRIAGFFGADLAGVTTTTEDAADALPRGAGLVVVPDDLAAALDAEPAARQTFDALSYSNKSWHVLQVDGAKTDETRQRRIAKSVDTLRQGKPR